jgi:hypothetical protein
MNRLRDALFQFNQGLELDPKSVAGPMNVDEPIQEIRSAIQKQRHRGRAQYSGP